MKKENMLETKKYKQDVETLLLRRAEAGSLESEADFIAGASVAFAHFDVWNKIPPMWILAPISGRSVLEELGFDKNVDESGYQMVTIKTNKQEEYEC